MVFWHIFDESKKTMFVAMRCHHVEQLSSIYLHLSTVFAATVVICQWFAVGCAGSCVLCCCQWLSALIEKLLSRMFPHPKSKSQLTRPENSEIFEMLWRTRTCLANAADVLPAAKWLILLLWSGSEFNSCRETLDVVQMFLFVEDDDVPPQQEPVGQARCISQHQ